MISFVLILRNGYTTGEMAPIAPWALTEKQPELPRSNHQAYI